ncbi:MAG: GNAT family N-acetyltransferase [Lachnospiraceae bacterium]|nr:GNAT family N-acetyltransferase [Lachnospiraceae bacterium]
MKLIHASVQQSAVLQEALGHWNRQLEEEVRTAGKAQKQQGADPEDDQDDAARMEEVLVLTDDPECALLLFRQGIAVIGVSFDGAGAVFTGIPYVYEDPQEANLRDLERTWRRFRNLPWEIGQTKRCLIRETSVADVDAFYRIYAEPSITRYTENLFADPAEERAYTQDYQKHVYAFYGFGMWTICRKDTGEVIGRAGISMREGFELPELGYIIAVPYQQQGYASEVCRAILEIGQTEYGMDAFQILTESENTASIKLCERLGFVYADQVEVGGKSLARYLLQT